MGIIVVVAAVAAAARTKEKNSESFDLIITAVEVRKGENVKCSRI